MFKNRVAVKLGLTIMGLFTIVFVPLGYVVNSIFNDFFSDRLEREMMHLPVESAVATAKQIQSLLILAGIGALFIAIGMTYIISKRLSQPLLQMENAARRMTRGDLDVKVDVLTNDETGSLARTINELGEELKRYRETRSEFFANISHELRTPITYLEGYSKVLADGLIESEEEKANYLQIIQQEARRMKTLVEDLFELSKMEEGRFSFNTEWIDLSKTLQLVIDKIKPAIIEKGLILEQHILPEVPLILGDRIRMEQIFYNLLDNAIRYTDQGIVSVSMFAEGSYLTTEISDTGAGIPAEELPYVFERFYRVEKSRSREFGGTGLGLAIVKNLVELHNGKIKISSEINRGTTFIIKLPITKEVMS